MYVCHFVHTICSTSLQITGTSAPTRRSVKHRLRPIIESFESAIPRLGVKTNAGGARLIIVFPRTGIGASHVPGSAPQHLRHDRIFRIGEFQFVFPALHDLDGVLEGSRSRFHGGIDAVIVGIVGGVGQTIGAVFDELLGPFLGVAF